MDNFQGQLIYWFGPLSASVLIALLYWAVPPQHVAICQQVKDDRKKQLFDEQNNSNATDMEIIRANNEIAV